MDQQNCRACITHSKICPCAAYLALPNKRNEHAHLCTKGACLFSRQVRVHKKTNSKTYCGVKHVSLHILLIPKSDFLLIYKAKILHKLWTKIVNSVHSATNGHSNNVAPLFMPPRPPCCCL